MKSGPLTRYHKILSVVAAAPGGLAVSELMKKAELPKSSAHRMAATLCEAGYLTHSDSGNYTLGPALDDIIRSRISASYKGKAFTKALRELENRFEETAFCARLSNGVVEIFDVVTPRSGERSYVYPGLGSRPLDKCSSSRIILAFRDKKEIESWLEQECQQSNLSASEIEAAHEAIEVARRDGYAVCDGEIDEGVCSVACPVFLEPFGVLYSIGITGPAARIKEVSIDKIVKELRIVAENTAVNLSAEYLAERSL
ncbi:IclR family transcriptional regulator [Sneathiella litorea]|uniref:Helix-turn-helix domain-containing protein n=1 Tax=Sneathiella litorea TaxID=2606216 RepID=A0A6L8W882_9PROT|nr:IclR family transcriptional regulator [Sneathiella litorea]MZR30682.1 helix-turn-helix domain-containing protein [Sneathiella litorea]